MKRLTLVFFIISFGFVTIFGIDKPYVHEGLIDLKTWNFSKNGSINLKGRWDFYPNTFLEYNNTVFNLPSSNKIKVPDIWNNAFPEKSYGKGYGTYHVKVILPEINITYGLLLNTSGTSTKVFIDSVLLGGAGEPAKTRSEVVPSYCNKVYYFNPKKQEVNIIIQVANFHHRKGGLWSNVILGLKEDIDRSHNNNFAIAMFFLGVFISIGFYNLILFILRKNNWYLLFFGIFCVILAFRILFSDNYFIYSFFHLNWRTVITVEYFSFYLAVPVFGLYTYSLYPRDYSRKVAFLYFWGCVFFSLLSLFLPIHLFTYGVIFIQVCTIFLGLYIIYIIYSAWNKKRNGIKVFFAGFLILFIAVINDILHANDIINTPYLAPTGIFVFILFQSYLVSSVFSKKFNRIEKLSSNLNAINQNLELLIEARTLEVSLKNEAIEQKNKILEDQKHEISFQKEILEDKNNSITSSINYASKIQNALLPENKIFMDHFNDFFVIYKPQDIISGDFYWAYEWGEKLFFALADCTGHSVPGAFMSVLGLNLLNEVLTQYISVFTESSFKANQILNILRKRIKKALHQNSPYGENQDGIDISFCVYDKMTKKMQFAGANPLFYIVRKSDIPFEVVSDSVIKYSIDKAFEIIQLKGDRMPVGVFPIESEFTNYIFSLHKGDKLYLFTDGFSDMIGGKRDKKFLQKRVRQIISEIHHFSMKEQKNIISKTIDDWLIKSEQLDDISILGLKIK